MKEPKICLRPGCGGKAKVRGLCDRCYAVALGLVKKGAATWVLLEGSGKALPIKRPWGNNGESNKPIRQWMMDEDLQILKASPIPPPSMVDALKDAQPVVSETVSIGPPKTPRPRAKAPANGEVKPAPNIITSPVPTNQVQMCADCQTPLTGQFARTRGGQALCVPCAQKRASSNVPTRLE